ncbi:MAG: flagellin [Tepidisphaeraceae bacterium]
MSRINTNIPSLQAMTTYSKNSADLNTHLQRLSTGLRINSGKDDPSGLIASETLRSEMEGINQAVSNTQRADNVINTAEGALSEVSSLLLNMQSLTNQAANTGALSDDEIQANQLQVDSILNSINRIANTTQFNGKKLIDGSMDYVTSGVASTSINVLSVNAAKIPDNGSLTMTVQVSQSAQTGHVDFTGTIGSAATTIEIGGVDGTTQVSFAGNTANSAVAYAINQLTGSTGVSATANGSAGISLDSTGYGKSQFVSVKALSGTFVSSKDYGRDAEVSINGQKASVDGIKASVRTNDLDVDVTIDTAFNTNGSETSFSITGGGAKFQIGSRVQSQGQIQIGIGSVNSTNLGNNQIGFLNSLGSGGDNSLVGGNTVQAQKIITSAIEQVATLRGRLGALQKNVLETNINSLSVALENVTASESDIRDADFAKETASLTRSQILVQANQSVLSQANSAPQQVLSLLRG